MSIRLCSCHNSRARAYGFKFQDLQIENCLVRYRQELLRQPQSDHCPAPFRNHRADDGPDAGDGFVLVAESSGKRIAGSVVLRKVMRLQAPLPVPERYDPPLVVRFMIDKS